MSLEVVPAGQEGLVSALTAALQPAGLVLRQDWTLKFCQRHGVPPTAASSRPQLQPWCEKALAEVLVTDLRLCAEGRAIPPDLEARHNVRLAGPLFLQVDEAVDVGACADQGEGGSSSGSKRLLKLALCDGGPHQAVAMEYRPIPGITANTPAGYKIVVKDVLVRRGMLLLAGDNVKVLGGSVPALVALQKAVNAAGAADAAAAAAVAAAAAAKAGGDAAAAVRARLPERARLSIEAAQPSSGGGAGVAGAGAAARPPAAPPAAAAARSSSSVIAGTSAAAAATLLSSTSPRVSLVPLDLAAQQLAQEEEEAGPDSDDDDFLEIIEETPGSGAPSAAASQAAAGRASSETAAFTSPLSSPASGAAASSGIQASQLGGSRSELKKTLRAARMSLLMPKHDPAARGFPADPALVEAVVAVAVCESQSGSGGGGAAARVAAAAVATKLGLSQAQLASGAGVSSAAPASSFLPSPADIEDAVSPLSFTSGTGVGGVLPDDELALPLYNDPDGADEWKGVVVPPPAEGRMADDDDDDAFADLFQAEVDAAAAKATAAAASAEAEPASPPAAAASSRPAARSSSSPVDIYAEGDDDDWAGLLGSQVSVEGGASRPRSPVL